ncbi:cache domain-containing protein [Paenibacillus sp. CC-CFT747]|nr:cache domain-containing protein [Paenibacillus sp. CC-CFT747]
MGSILYRYRIDYVFFISFGVFITVLLALITWISYTLSAREQATSTSYYQQGMLLELNKQLTGQMRNVEQSSLAVSLNSAFVDYLTLKGDYYTRNKARDTLAKDYLTPLVNSSPSIQSLQVYVDSPTLTDRQADVQFLPLASIREEPWYAAAEKADSVWIGEREVSSAQGNGRALGFVRRINSKDGVNIGVLVINLKAKVLEDILNGNQANPSRLLFDTGGRLMLRTGRTAVPPGVYEQAEGGAGGPASDAGHRRISLPDHSSPPRTRSWSGPAPSRTGGRSWSLPRGGKSPAQAASSRRRSPSWAGPRGSSRSDSRSCSRAGLPARSGSFCS